MRRAEGAEEGIPAVVEGIPEAEGDNRVAAGSPGVAEDSPPEAGILAEEDKRVVADTPVVEDSLSEAGILAVAEDNRVEAGIPAVAAGNLAAAEDNRVEAGIPAVVAGNSRPAVAYRRMTCRTWHKRYCPGLPALRNWGRRSAAECRMRYSISVRERCWLRTWGILSIAAFHLSITSITICKGKIIPIVDV
jgi:hypothetical protein